MIYKRKRNNNNNNNNKKQANKQILLPPTLPVPLVTENYLVFPIPPF